MYVFHRLVDKTEARLLQMRRLSNVCIGLVDGLGLVEEMALSELVGGEVLVGREVPVEVVPEPVLESELGVRWLGTSSVEGG